MMKPQISRSVADLLAGCAVAVPVLLLFLPVAAQAQQQEPPKPADVPAQPAPTTPTPPEAPATPETTPATPGPGTFRFGLDYYLGFSNIPGYNRITTDGNWAGQSQFYYSSASLNWNKDSGGGTQHQARISLGIGELLTNRSQAVVDQPLEAYYTFTSNKTGSITVGKYFTPFGLQEWQYEPRWGIAWAGQFGAASKLSYSLSGQYNETYKNVNGYARVGYQVAPSTSIGISGGFGKGWSYSTSHDVGFGADLTHDFNGVAQLIAEYAHADSPNGEFDYGVGRVTFGGLGPVAPFIGYWTWRDTAQEMGNWRSGVVGTGYQLTPNVGLEAAYSRTGDKRDVYWLQTHITY